MNYYTNDTKFKINDILIIKKIKKYELVYPHIIKIINVEYIFGNFYYVVRSFNLPDLDYIETIKLVNDNYKKTSDEQKQILDILYFL